MSSKSKKGNALPQAPHKRDGAFGGKERPVYGRGWKPGDSRGCNYGPNNPGRRRGDKVNFGEEGERRKLWDEINKFIQEENA